MKAGAEMFRVKRKYVVQLTPAERKLIRYSLMELRNKLIKAGFDTKDIDMLIQRMVELT